MNFDYTYIQLLGFKLYEPVTILTNLFITVYCIYCFVKINSYKFKLANSWAWFFMLIGLSSFIGSAAHGAHYQLGDAFLNITWFLMNAVSLIAIYYCFMAAQTYYSKGKPEPNKIYAYIVVLWILVLLAFTLVLNNFVLIKIHAGIVLSYSLIVHAITLKNKQKGSGYIVAGILISFFSIVIHSLKISFSDWFNYKDIAHIIMLCSLYYIFKGASLKLSNNKKVLSVN